MTFVSETLETLQYSQKTFQDHLGIYFSKHKNIDCLSKQMPMCLG